MSNLSCNEVVRRLPALVAGDLDRTAIEEIEEHTETCWECDQDLRESRGLSACLDQLWSNRLSALGTYLNGNGCHPGTPPDHLPQVISASLDRIASFAPVETELGTIHLVATDRGLVRVGLPGVGESDIDAWCRANDLVPLYDEEAIEPYAIQIHDYFRGRRTAFEMTLDLRTVTPFMRHVLEALQTIPYGDVRNYRDIAIKIGNPNAQRAVGNAVKRNPVPIVVPCHRVIKTDGTIGGYAGGPLLKERLLKLEGALLPS